MRLGLPRRAGGGAQGSPRRRSLALLLGLISLFSGSTTGYAAFVARSARPSLALPPPLEPFRPPAIVRPVRSGPRETAEVFFERRSDLEGEPAEWPGGIAPVRNRDELGPREREELLRGAPWALAFTGTRPITGRLGGGDGQAGGGGGIGGGARGSPLASGYPSGGQPLWGDGGQRGRLVSSHAIPTGGGSTGPGGGGVGPGIPGAPVALPTPEPGAPLLFCANLLVAAQALRRRRHQRS